ncbi:hypothetical protein ACIOC1_19665 [Streptomyces sp. NPDC088197]|uniref:hypothetical protein n=1 Tax=unclassified Streptomyces TaxID=2593676 RepID=UPI0033ACEF44
MLWLACLVLVWALLLLAGVLDVVAFVASASDTPYQGRADDRTAAWWTLFGLVIPLAFLAAVLTSLERRARRRRGGPPGGDRRSLTDGSVG